MLGETHPAGLKEPEVGGVAGRHNPSDGLAVVGDRDLRAVSDAGQVAAQTVAQLADADDLGLMGANWYGAIHVSSIATIARSPQGLLRTIEATVRPSSGLRISRPCRWVLAIAEKLLHLDRGVVDGLERVAVGAVDHASGAVPGHVSDAALVDAGVAQQ